ncbi:MAG: helicase-related protein [Rhizonema sp. NSF051]|nr:helicase-related protein [Rhizonema sp. NSF051]
MSTSKNFFIYQCKCQDCGEEFFFTEKAREIDIANGLSSPSSCAKCRYDKIKAANKTGLSHWAIPVETDFALRSLEEVGLGKLDSQIDLPKEIEYQPNKKIAEKFQILEPLVNALIQNLIDPQGSRVSILIAPTGTGKTVWATSQILCSPIGREGQILVTQPRKVTLRAPEGKNTEETTPGFIAKHIIGAPGAGAGHEVGFLYRGESTQYDQYTKLLFVTDGLLVNWILSGDIERYSVIIIDEAHEQSLNMELIFALLRYKLPLFPRLRVVIMSATVDPEKFQTYFNCFGSENSKKVPVFQPEYDKSYTIKKVYDRWPDTKGRYSYSNDDQCFLLPKYTNEIPNSVAQLVTDICKREEFTKLKRPQGDILVFVPTIQLVNLTKAAIEDITEDSRLEVLSCHAQMKIEEEEAFWESEKRAEQAFNEGKNTVPQRVIIATTYAETSATFPNLCFVIDSGYISEPMWNAKTCTREFKITRHSQAGCNQRKGRVGRTQDGEVFRLYTKEQFENEFRITPLPEVARSNLDMFLLKAAAAGIGDLKNFHWLGLDDDETREDQNFEKERAIQTLKKRGAIDEDGSITQLGFQLQKFELDTVEQALFLLESDRFGCALEVATFLAFTDQSTSLFEENERGLLGQASWMSGCYDDLEYYLRLFYHCNKKNIEDEWWKKYGFRKDIYDGINRKRDDLLKQLYIEKSKTLKERNLDLNRLHRVRLLLTWCMLEWVYVRDSSNTANCLFVPFDLENCPCAEPVIIGDNSACTVMGEVSAFICMERKNTKYGILAHHIICIDPSWVSQLAKASVVSVSIMMKQVIEERERQFFEATRNRVLSVPKLTDCLSIYKEGEQKKFRLIGSQKNEEKTEQINFLAYDLDSEELLIIKFQEKNKQIETGATFRGYVEAVVVEKRILTLSQWKFYPEATKIENVKVITPNKNEHVLEVELEPGIKGILRIDKLGESEEWIKQAYDGKLPLQVKKANNKSIRLEPVLPKLIAQSNYDGYVIGFLSGEGEEAGIVVEIAPNIKGLIPKSKIPESDLLTYQIGDKVNVILHDQEQPLRFELSKLELTRLIKKSAQNSSYGQVLQRQSRYPRNCSQWSKFNIRLVAGLTFFLIFTTFTTIYLILNRN